MNRFSFATLVFMMVLPRPVVSQRTAPAQTVVADSGANAVMQLGRLGRWADVERVGLRFLANSTPSATNGEACAVLIAVTLAKSALQAGDSARASMSRFDASCTGVKYLDWFPGEANRVRRVVNGEPASSVYASGRTGYTLTTGGATDVMMLNREGRRAEAEQVGLRYLGRFEHRVGAPEVCAVLIGVTFAQAMQQRAADAKASLTRFDLSCTGVRYLDWFPAEADRVRRLVNRTPLLESSTDRRP